MIPAGSGRRSATADGDSAFAMSSLTSETQARLQSINRFLVVAHRVDGIGSRRGHGSAPS